MYNEKFNLEKNIVFFIKLIQLILGFTLLYQFPQIACIRKIKSLKQYDNVREFTDNALES